MREFLLFMTFTIFSSVNLFAKTPVMPKKWHQLNKLIEKEKKTILSLGKLSPRLRFRLLELQTERLKLIREKENLMFLSRSLGRTKKSDYFKESRSLEKTIQRSGLRIIRRFPGYRAVADIYYTLAMNSRDFNKGKKAISFLYASLKNAEGGSPVIYMSKAALAEELYNKKSYKKALRLYRDVLKNENDPWRTKHLFNSAWSHLKSGKKTKGIAQLRESFNLSENKSFQDIRDQALESLSLFYVLDSKVDEGIAFFLKNLNEPTPYLLKLAHHAASKGKFEKSKKCLKSALERSRKNNKVTVSIRLAELTIYRNFKQFSDHMIAAKALVELKNKGAMNPHEKSEAIDKIKELAGFLQVKVSRNQTIGNKSYNSNDLSRTIEYFNILVQLDSKKTDQYRFFQGETYLAVGSYLEATRKYQQSLEYGIKIHKKRLLKESLAKKGKPKVTKRKNILNPYLKGQRKVLNSLLAVLDHADWDKETKTKYTLYTFNKHITLLPIDKKSQKIYPKLFNLYLKKPKVEEALVVLQKYQRSYPRNRLEQRALYSLAFDYYIKKKNSDRVALLIKKIEKGYLSFPKKYVEKATLLLGSILFETYQKLSKIDAIKGNHSLFLSEKYPQTIKAKSAFHISTLNLALGKTKDSFTWLLKAIPLYKEKDLLALVPFLHQIAGQYYEAQDFKSSAHFSKYILKKFCHKRIPHKVSFYKKSVELQLIENNFRAAIKNKSLGKKCGISKKHITSMNKSLIAYSYKFGKKKTFYSLFKAYGSRPELINSFVSPLLKNYWRARKDSKKRMLSFIKKKINLVERSKSLLTKENILAINAISEYDQFLKNSAPLMQRRYTQKKKFDEAYFNSELEKNIAKLTSSNTLAQKVLKLQDPETSLRIYKHMEQSYSKFSSNLSSFTPLGVPKEYQTGFKAQMQKLASQMAAKSREYTNTSRPSLFSNDLLTTHNDAYSPSNSMMSSISYRYPASKIAASLDTLGGKIE